MSLDMLETARTALRELANEVVFLGGATLVLWITDPGAPPGRPTKDVDVVVEVTTRAGFVAFNDKLRAAGFSEDQESGVICRWLHSESGLLLDAMPADPGLLGFANEWQRASLSHAIERQLPSGLTLRAVSPPFLVATKLEAFLGRGRRDFVGSRDFADIISLVDGREELVAEVAHAPEDLRTYLAARLADLTADSGFLDGIFAVLRPDMASQTRAETVVLPRIREVVAHGRG